MWLERIQEIKKDDYYNSLNLSVNVHLAKFIIHLLRDKIKFLITDISKENPLTTCLQIERVVSAPGINEIITNDEFTYYLQLTLWQEITNEFNVKEKEREAICSIFKVVEFLA